MSSAHSLESFPPPIRDESDLITDLASLGEEMLGALPIEEVRSRVVAAARWHLGCAQAGCYALVWVADVPVLEPTIARGSGDPSRHCLSLPAQARTAWLSGASSPRPLLLDDGVGLLAPVFAQGELVGALWLQRSAPWTERARAAARMLAAMVSLQESDLATRRSSLRAITSSDRRAREHRVLAQSLAGPVRADARAALGFATLALESGAEGSTHLLAAQRHAAAAAARVETLAAVAGVDDLVVRTERTALADLLRAAVVDARAQHPGVYVELHAFSLPVLRCDPTLLRRAFDAVLRAALRRCESGSLNLSARGEVRDDGVWLWLAHDAPPPRDPCAAPCVDTLYAERLVSHGGGHLETMAHPERGTLLLLRLEGET